MNFIDIKHADHFLDNYNPKHTKKEIFKKLSYYSKNHKLNAETVNFIKIAIDFRINGSKDKN